MCPSIIRCVVACPPEGCGAWQQLFSTTRNPVSYTHLDVYKRQEQQIGGERQTEKARERVFLFSQIPALGAQALLFGLELHQACLLYTSRCV